MKWKYSLRYTEYSDNEITMKAIMAFCNSFVITMM